MLNTWTTSLPCYSAIWQTAKRDAMVFRDIYQLLHKRLGQQGHLLCLATA